jgi:hypothetical protein
MEQEIVTVARDSERKAEPPKKMTFAGIITDMIGVFLKASAPIVITFSGIITDVIAVS